jgi:THO complex subunit 2
MESTDISAPEGKFEEIKDSTDSSSSSATSMEVDGTESVGTEQPMEGVIESVPAHVLANATPPPRFHPALKETIEAVVRILPQSVWSIIPPHFYVTFWQTSLHEIFVPKARYQAEIVRLRALADALESDRSDMTAAAVARRRKDRDRNMLLIQQLEKEMKHQEDLHNKTMERLRSERPTWFWKGQ